MAKKYKKPLIPPEGVKPGVDANDRHILPELLIQRTEEETLKQFSDYNLDRENEKFQLLSGVETSWKELKDAHRKYKKFISDKLRDWEFTFPEELYRQWRRLNNWDMNSKSRPMIFAAYTVRDIYGSLPKEVYTTLDEINEYVYPGVRMFRYCQLLTEDCHAEVRRIIKSAIDIATTSKDLYEYRVKLAATHGIPFSKNITQLDAFRDNDSIIGG